MPGIQGGFFFLSIVRCFYNLISMVKNSHGVSSKNNPKKTKKTKKRLAIKQARAEAQRAR